MCPACPHAGRSPHRRGTPSHPVRTRTSTGSTSHRGSGAPGLCPAPPSTDPPARAPSATRPVVALTADITQDQLRNRSKLGSGRLTLTPPVPLVVYPHWVAPLSQVAAQGARSACRLGARPS